VAGPPTRRPQALALALGRWPWPSPGTRREWLKAEAGTNEVPGGERNVASRTSGPSCSTGPGQRKLATVRPGRPAPRRARLLRSRRRRHRLQHLAHIGQGAGHCGATPRVALVVDDEDHPFSFVLVEGVATVFRGHSLPPGLGAAHRDPVPSTRGTSTATPKRKRRRRRARRGASDRKRWIAASSHSRLGAKALQLTVTPLSLLPLGPKCRSRRGGPPAPYPPTWVPPSPTPPTIPSSPRSRPGLPGQPRRDRARIRRGRRRRSPRSILATQYDPNGGVGIGPRAQH